MGEKVEEKVEEKVRMDGEWKKEQGKSWSKFSIYRKESEPRPADEA